MEIAGLSADWNNPREVLWHIDQSNQAYQLSRLKDYFDHLGFADKPADDPVRLQFEAAIRKLEPPKPRNTARHRDPSFIF